MASHSHQRKRSACCVCLFPCLFVCLFMCVCVSCTVCFPLSLCPLCLSLSACDWKPHHTPISPKSCSTTACGTQYPLPEHYVWAGDWEVDTPPPCDENQWQYARFGASTYDQAHVSAANRGWKWVRGERRGFALFFCTFCSLVNTHAPPRRKLREAESCC